MKSKMQIGSLSSLHLQSSLGSRALLSVFLLAVPFLISCGGGSAAVNPPPPTVAVTISPSAVTLPAGGSQTFTPTVTGTSNTAVTWTIQEGAAGGTITSAGVYAAPQVPGTYHVVATSVADNTKSATATVTVPPVSVTISPSVVSLGRGESQTFTATVTGSSNVSVTWTIQEGAAGGSITSAGVYAAPQVPGTYHVVATSQADSTKTAMATVTVPPVSIAISPDLVTVVPGQVQNFTAFVNWTTNRAVTWEVQEGAAGGSITSAGVYTAPQSLGNFHVIATSQADSTKSAKATVNVVPIAVTISPQADTLGPAGVRAFTANVTGPDQRVSWAVQEGVTGGTITSSGIYTAPTTLGIYHVIATSVADTSKSATATVTVVKSGFRPTGSMASRRDGGHTATLLPNGTVMIVGGCEPDSNDPDQPCVPFPETGIAELYDPISGTFSTSGRMGMLRTGHTATLLQNGTVLIVGGLNTSSFPFVHLTTAEIYNPATGLFTPTGSMATGRVSHTATLLANGTVLIAGGFNGSPPVAAAEIYDPATGLFTPTGSMATGRDSHTATLLSNGTVLIAGGVSGSGIVATAEIYDPATGLFTPTGSMRTARWGDTATLLSNGAVLIAGGIDTQPSLFLATAEVYNPATGLFTSTGNMRSTRYGHTATRLSNGTVLIAGGVDGSVQPSLFLTTAEVYDPAAGLFMATGSMEFARIGHTATLLLNGQVLVAGGDGYSPATAELYQ